MSYTKQIELQCDRPGCITILRFDTDSIRDARTKAEENFDWECSRDEDLCGPCTQLR